MSPRTPESRHAPVVLVVDDAPSSLGMLCDALEASGYTVLVARDGESALRAARAGGARRDPARRA